MLPFKYPVWLCGGLLFVSYPTLAQKIAPTKVPVAFKPVVKAVENKAVSKAPTKKPAVKPVPPQPSAVKPSVSRPVETPDSLRKPLTLGNMSYRYTAIKFSPDGSLLALVDLGRVTLWDMANRQTGQATPRKIVDNDFRVGESKDLAFSADSRTLIGYDEEAKQVKFWDARSGVLKRTLLGVEAATFSPDSKTLFAQGINVGQLCDTATGEAIKTLQGAEATSDIYRIAFSDDGKVLICAGAGLVKCGDLGERFVSVNKPSDSGLPPLRNGAVVSSLIDAPTGVQLGDVIRRVGDVSVANWAEVSHELLRQKPNENLTLRVQRGAQWFDIKVILGAQGAILPYLLVWDLTKDVPPALWGNGFPAVKDPLGRFNSPSVPPGPFAISHAGTTVAFLNKEGAVQLLDVASGKIKQTLGSALEGTNSLAFSADDQTLVATGYNSMPGAGFPIPAEDLNQLDIIPASGASDIKWQVSIAAVPPQSAASRSGLRVGDVIESVSTNTTEQQVSYVDRFLQSAQEHKVGERFSVRVARGKEKINVSVPLIATTFPAPVARLWNVATGEVRTTLWEPTTGSYDFSTYSEAFNNNQYFLMPEAGMIANHDRTHGCLHLWNMTTGEPKRTIKSFGDLQGYYTKFEPIFSPDGKTLMAPGADGGLWNSETGAFKADLRYLYRFAFSPDNSLLIYADLRNMHVYDFRSEPKP